MTDWERVVEYLKDNPGASVMDVRLALWISNVTGRMSDARANGVSFMKWRDDRGIWRYRIEEPKPPIALGEQGSFFSWD